MNRQCQNCGRIITIPDIPLPPGYTQQCTACGFANAVAEEEGGSMEGSATWESSFDASMDFLKAPVSEPPKETQSEKMVWKFDEKLRDMETRLRDELSKNQPNVDLRRGAAEVPEDKFFKHHLLQSGEVLVCTSNSNIYRNMDSILRDRGYQVQACSDLEQAFKTLVHSYYEIIFLDQQFLNSGETGRRVFETIKQVPTEIRRLQHIILLTPNITTAESQVFYQWGIDLNIHPRDLDRVDSLISKLIGEKRQLLEPLLSQ